MNSPSYSYKAKVLRVVDGDTVIASIDLGFRTHTILPLRLHGINAPEPHNEGGKDSTEHLKVLLGAGDCTVMTYKNPVDKYGRWLAILFVDGNDINRQMVDDGMAVWA